MNKKNIISQSPLFGGLTEEQLTSVSQIALSKTAKKKEAIFFEGDDASGFYMVASGKIKVFKTSFEGKEQILHIFGASEPFGEVAVFYDIPFPASAETLADSELLFFPKKEFVGLVTAHPELALSMLAVMSIRLHRFTVQIENLTLKEVPSRLAGYLHFLAKKQEREDQVTLDIPKMHLANLLGTSPETLSRVFARMSEQGLIRVEGKTITLLNMEELLNV